MTDAVEAARRIVAANKCSADAAAIAVARALLASVERERKLLRALEGAHMTDDDVEHVAKAINRTAFAEGRAPIEEWLAYKMARAAIAAMPSAGLDPATIERCAKRAEEVASNVGRGDFGLIGPVGVAVRMAHAIRALATKTDRTEVPK